MHASGHAMRWLPFAVLLLVPAATAQDACTESDPCAWVIDVDASGFDTTVVSQHNGTVGDWIVLDISNLDDLEHTIGFQGRSWTVGSIDFVTTEPFELTEAGEFQITDSPTGDTLPVLVTLNDSVDVQQGERPITDDADEGAPGPGLVALLAGLAAVAIARRR